MRPLARQRIYKFSILKNLINFLSFGLLNIGKTTKLKKAVDEHRKKDKKKKEKHHSR